HGGRDKVVTAAASEVRGEDLREPIVIGGHGGRDTVVTAAATEVRGEDLREPIVIGGHGGRDTVVTAAASEVRGEDLREPRVIGVTAAATQWSRRPQPRSAVKTSENLESSGSRRPRHSGHVVGAGSTTPTKGRFRHRSSWSRP